jgi:hypothetical protein
MGVRDGVLAQPGGDDRRSGGFSEREVRLRVARPAADDDRRALRGG